MGRLPSSIMIFGCGYVGTALAAALLGRGSRVGGLTRNPEKAAELRAMGLSPVVVADLAGGAWHGMLEDAGRFEAAVNCVSSAGGGIEGYWRSYYEGQRSILQWAAGRRMGTFIFTGSTSVYPQDGGVWVDEEADTADAPETGKVLLQAERLLAASAGTFDRWFVLRLAGIYGPGRHMLLDRVRERVAELPGRGDHHLNLVHRDDIVGALLAALSAPAEVEGGIFNLSDGRPETKEAVVRWLAERVGVAPPRFNPDLVSRRSGLRGGHVPDRRIGNARAVRVLGWRPRFPGFRDGYRDILTETSRETEAGRLTGAD